MDIRLPAWLRVDILLTVFTCAIVFCSLNRVDLAESTEPREAGVAAGMLQSGQFLVPTLNGRPFLEKPPLSYWLQAASIDTFGYKPFAPRLPSALAGIATVLIFVFFLRKSPYQRWLVLITGTLLITMASFFGYTRTAGQDTLLCFGISLALLSFYFVRESPNRSLWVLFSIGIAIATMTKGIVGLAIPGCVIFTYLLYETLSVNKRFAIADWIKPAGFALLGLLPILLWLLLLFNAQGADAVKEIVWANSVGRFSGDYSQGAHAEPFYYYLKYIPSTYQPWTLLVYLALFFSFKKPDKYFGNRSMFFAIWIIASISLLSLSAGKRPSYLLMLYPAAAALAAHFIVARIASYVEGGARLPSAALKWLAVFYAVALSALPLAISLVLMKNGHRMLAAGTTVFAIPLILVIWRSAIGRSCFNLVTSCAGVIFISYTAYYSWVAPEKLLSSSARLVMENLANFEREGHPVVLFQPTERMEGAASYYLKHRVPAIVSEGALVEVLSAQPSTVILVSDPSTKGMRSLKDLLQVNYGNTRYHYLTRG